MEYIATFLRNGSRGSASYTPQPIKKKRHKSSCYKGCCGQGCANKRTQAFYQCLHVNIDNTEWSSLSHEEKNRQLLLHQKKTPDTFLERGAISQEQHDKSLQDLIEKMGMEAEGNTDAEQV